MKEIGAAAVRRRAAGSTTGLRIHTSHSGDSER
jgi:hypothetical protein